MTGSGDPPATAVADEPDERVSLVRALHADAGEHADPSAEAVVSPTNGRRARGVWASLLVAGVAGAAAVAVMSRRGLRKEIRRIVGDNAIGHYLQQSTFDCAEDYDNDVWVLAWSYAKQEYCCQTEGKACVIPTSTTTLPTLAPTQTTTVTTLAAAAGTTTTTTAQNMPTTSTTSAPFDCESDNSGAVNAELGWSEWKRRWCCTYKQVGCPDEDSAGQISGYFHIRGINFPNMIGDVQAQIGILSALQHAVYSTAVGHPVLGPLGSNVTLKYWKSVGGSLGVHFKVKIPPATPDHLARDRLTCENLEEVLPRAAVTAPGIDRIQESPLVVNRCVINLHIAKLKCSCENGKAVTGQDCPGSGGHLCASCDAGYTLTDQAQCMVNKCKCLNGIGAQGPACHTDDAYVCGFCSAGFHFKKVNEEQLECIRNSCTCTNGIAAEGPKCTMDQANMCQQCDKGFHLNTETYQCEPNVCTCQHGTAPEPGSKECTANEAHICKVCDETFHLEGNRCKANICTCSGGTPAAGAGPPGCFQHGTEVCVNCNGVNSYLSADYKCGSKKCQCHGGLPVDGDVCTTNRGNMCKACDPGYKLWANTQQCVKDHCHCAGGLPVNNCTETGDGRQHCSSCEAGFHQLGDQCLPNVCKCDNGQAAQGETCLVNGGHVCAECNPGFHPQVHLHETNGHLTVQCAANICSCRHGTPASSETTPYCHTNELEFCVQCEDGFHVGPDHKCRRIHCSCENGIGKAGTACKENGLEDCLTCDLGYELTVRGAVRDTERCMEESSRDSFEFDCHKDYETRYLGWSDLKKMYCCDVENIGCVAEATAGLVCQPSHGEDTCERIPCCKFSGSCQPDGEATAICHSTATIKLRASTVLVKRMTSATQVLHTSHSDRGLCLAADASQAGSQLQVLNCNEWDPLQQWVIEAKAGNATSLKMTTGRCVDFVSPTAVSPDYLHLVDCADLSDRMKAETWAVENGNIVTTSKMCLATEEPGALGIKVALEPCKPVPEQIGRQVWQVGNAVAPPEPKSA